MTIQDVGYGNFGEWAGGIDEKLPGIDAIFYENQVELFRCPTDSTFVDTGALILGTHPTDAASVATFIITPLGGGASEKQTRTYTNYVANAGALAVTDTPSNPDFEGLYGPIRSRVSDSFDTVIDGASNVVLWAESIGGIDMIGSGLTSNARDSAACGGISVGRADLYGITEGPAAFPFFGTAGEIATGCNFGSPHPDTINVLRADGTVHPVNRNIQPETFGRLCAAARWRAFFDLRR